MDIAPLPPQRWFVTWAFAIQLATNAVFPLEMVPVRPAMAARFVLRLFAIRTTSAATPLAMALARSRMAARSAALELAA